MSEQKLQELGQHFLKTYAKTIEAAMYDMSELERYRNESSYPVESYLWPIYRRLQQLDGLTENLRKYLKDEE
jgi:hypothetical protein